MYGVAEGGGVSVAGVDGMVLDCVGVAWGMGGLETAVSSNHSRRITKKAAYGDLFLLKC